MASIKKPGEMLKALTPTEILSREELSSSWNEVVNSARDKTFNFLTFGLVAVEKKKQHPIVFKRFADNEELIPKKELERAMKLVLEDSVNFRQAMKTAGKDVDIEANVDLLVVDSKIMHLTRESFSKLKKPSVSKIEIMKVNLSEKKFITVLKGNDKPYLEHLDSIETKKIENHKQEKPDNLTDEEFESLYRGKIYSAIRQVSDFKEKVIDLTNEREELIKQVAKLEGQVELLQGMPNIVRANPIPELSTKKISL